MKAIFCGSFDPITKGHEDIVRRAARMFSELIVVVAKNPEKRYLFTEEQRVGFCRKTFADLPNVRVEAVEGIVVRYAERIGADVIVKGLRTATDFEFESQLAQINRLVSPCVETVFLTARPEFAAISSTYAKEFIRSRADLSAVLPSAIADDIKTITERT